MATLYSSAQELAAGGLFMIMPAPVTARVALTVVPRYRYRPAGIDIDHA